MVDEFVLHFHLGILEPKTFVCVVDLKSSLEDRSGPGILFEILFPLAVSDPNRQIVSLSSEFILEFPSLFLLVDMEFFLIHDSLDGRAEGDGPMDLGVLEDLVGSDLNYSSLLVFDRRGFHLNLWHGFSYKNNYIESFKLINFYLNKQNSERTTLLSTLGRMKSNYCDW